VTITRCNSRVGGIDPETLDAAPSELGRSSLLGAVNLGDLTYDELILWGQPSIENGKLNTGTATSSSSSTMTAIYFDADCLAGILDDRNLVVTIEDTTKVAAGDFLI